MAGLDPPEGTTTVSTWTLVVSDFSLVGGHHFYGRIAHPDDYTAHIHVYDWIDANMAKQLNADEPPDKGAFHWREGDTTERFPTRRQLYAAATRLFLLKAKPGDELRVGYGIAGDLPVLAVVPENIEEGIKPWS